MDRYAKLMLTIIAVALVWISVKDFTFISDAMASSGIVEVKIVDFDVSKYRPFPVLVQGEVKCTGD
ncbi:MAG: hypothetical protein EXR85_05925 [Xanthomonadales bacterium]|nr:hypothetical protein [Xanthomonadales bacterium]